MFHAEVSDTNPLEPLVAFSVRNRLVFLPKKDSKPAFASFSRRMNIANSFIKSFESSSKTTMVTVKEREHKPILHLILHLTERARRGFSLPIVVHLT